MSKFDKTGSKEWLTDGTPITTLYLNAKLFDPDCFLSKSLLNESLFDLWNKFVKFDNKGMRKLIKENILWDVPEFNNYLLLDKQEKTIKQEWGIITKWRSQVEISNHLQ